MSYLFSQFNSESTARWSTKYIYVCNIAGIESEQSYDTYFEKISWLSNGYIMYIKHSGVGKIKAYRL